MRWLCGALVVAVGAGCSRADGHKSAPAPPDAGTRDATVAIADAAPPPAFGEGAHDYRGTLGKATNLALHLVRTGSKLTGAYAYTAMGQPIGLQGSVGDDGTIALDEFVKGSVTGHIVLQREGRNLVGTWSDLAKKKTLPLKLEPSAPTPALVIDAGASPGAFRQGEQCLDDVACAAAEAERLFIAGDDAHEEFIDCTRFLDGTGVKTDLVRGRDCLERAVGNRSCDGASPFMDQGELVCLRLDGIGGRRDITGARKLLEGCFADITTDGLRDRVERVAANPSAPPIDFCKDIPGTTFVANDCLSRALRGEHDHASLLAKKIFNGLDERGRPLLRAATKAFAAYLDAEGEVTLAVFEGGSARIIFLLDRKHALEAMRAGALEAWSSFVAPVVAVDDVARARHESKDTSPTPDDPASAEHFLRVKKASADAENAWRRYRDAEIALYTHTFGKAQGEARVRDAVTVMLATERAKALKSSDEP